jgi:hypothetical protein
MRLPLRSISATPIIPSLEVRPEPETVVGVDHYGVEVQQKFLSDYSDS